MVLRIQTTVKELRGKTAVLLTDDQQELSVVAADIDPNLQIGDTCVLTIQPVAEAELSKEDLARTILNTLIANEQSEIKQVSPTEG